MDVNICVAENGRSFRLHNPQKRQIDEVKVDGCLMPDTKERCDYLFAITEPEMCVYYVELKGKDVIKAVSQINSTIEYTQSRFMNYRKACYVISSRVAPAMTPAIQVAATKLKKRHNAGLLIRCREHQVSIG